jgi:aspartyl-tRNA(Asn)/glutamyl-tRNA(Gln) amidotransferase subunit C
MIDEKTLGQLAFLCRIECSQEEKIKLQESLNRVLGYVDQLKEVKTEDVPPCYQVLETLTNVLREDVACNTLSREDFLSNAPSQAGGMIRVPPVIHFVDP